MSQVVTILDVGSSRISVMMGERGINDIPNIIGTGEVEYSGYSNAKFYEPEKLIKAVSLAIKLVENDAHMKAKNVFIGVPGEFTTTVCKDVFVTLSKKRKVSEDDINSLSQKGSDFLTKQYHIINIQPIYYVLDNNQILLNPINKTTIRLGGKLSYTLALNSFLNLFSGIMENLQIKSYDFCSSLLAEALFLFNAEQRDESLILIDIGYLSTSVIFIKGDGIVSQASFSIGGAHIIADFVKYLNISYDSGERLKRKLNLNIDFNENDSYEIYNKNNQIERYLISHINQIALERIKAIVLTIEKIIANWNLSRHINYYLTGGGITSIKGIQNLLSKLFKKNILIIRPDIPRFNKTYLSSQLGLMDMVLEQNKQPKSIFNFFIR